MKKIGHLLEQGFIILSLMLYTGGVLPVILSGGVSEGESSGSVDYSIMKLLFTVIYFITLYLLILHWKTTLYLLGKDVFILILLGITVASILWSYDPTITKGRVITIIGTSMSGFYLATRYTLKQQIILFGWLFGTIIILSIFFSIGLPKYGIMGGLHAGDWRGIYTHKNFLGKMMVVSAIIFLLLTMEENIKNKSPIYFGLFFSVLLIIMSKASSPLINLASISMLLFIFRIRRLPFEVMVPFIMATGLLLNCFFIWYQNNPDALFNLVGKDSTLTGRTELWAVVKEKIAQRPWLGYGYGTFWATDNIDDVRFAVGWPAPHAHNGILDLFLNVGIVGVIVFVFSLCQTSMRSLIWLRYCKTYEAFWPILFIVYLILSNLSESALMLQNDIYWVLYVSVAYSVLFPVENDMEKNNP